jgi:uncharacterized membrane protein YdbT with pleckstrin-like domain
LFTPASCGRYLLASKLRANYNGSHKMTELPQEKTLTRVRLHWGIFLPAICVALATSLYVGVQTLIVRQFIGMFRQLLGPIDQNPAFGQMEFMWSIPAILGVAVVVGLLVITWLSYTKSEISLTDRRMAFRTGFLWRHSGECPLENVESIYLTESLAGRLCGYGTVTFTTLGGSSFPLAYIGAPQQFHSILQAAVLKAKNTVRGLTKPAPGTPPQHEGDSRYMPKG